MLLYRGVTIEMDNELNGELIPKGKTHLSIPECGEEGVECGAGYEAGFSEGNALRAQQVNSDMKKLSFVSTSKCFNVAKRFATAGNLVDGYVYVLDTKLFAGLSVITRELENPIYPEEQEVSIRALDNGSIPESVIIDKQVVTCT